MKSYKNLLKKIVLFPTNKELDSVFKKYGFFELLLYYMITEINDNLFSFLSGIISSFPVTILFFVIEMKIEMDICNFSKFMLYVIMFIFSILTSIEIIKYTLIHIHINNSVENETNKEIYVNKKANLFNKYICSLKRSFFRAIVYSIILLIVMLSIFVVNNLSVS